MSESSASTEPAEAEPTESVDASASAVPATKRKPIRKPSKPDAVLAAAVDTARNGVLEVAGDTEVGEHLGVFPEAERLVTHRFAANVPGYGGWYWFATLARVPRGKDATICEVGLLPSEEALLAPDWVPWSERVRPEDTAEEVAAQELAEPGSDDAAAETDGANAAVETDGATGAVEADGAEPHAAPEPDAATGQPDNAVDGEPVDGEPAEADPEEQRTAGDPSAPGGESPIA